MRTFKIMFYVHREVHIIPIAYIFISILKNDSHGINILPYFTIFFWINRNSIAHFASCWSTHIMYVYIFIVWREPF